MCFLAKWSVCYFVVITSAFIFCFYLLFFIFMANVGKIRKYKKLEGRLSKRCDNLWNTTKSHNLNSVAYLQNGRVLFFDKVESWQLSTLLLLKVTLTRGCFVHFLMRLIILMQTPLTIWPRTTFFISVKVILS